MPFLFLNIISILALISFYTQSLVSHLSIFYSHCFYQHHQCVPHLHLLICQKEKQMAMETVEKILLKCFALFQTKGKQHFSNLYKSPKAQGRPSRFKKLATSWWSLMISSTILITLVCSQLQVTFDILLQNKGSLRISRYFLLAKDNPLSQPNSRYSCYLNKNLFCRGRARW